MVLSLKDRRQRSTVVTGDAALSGSYRIAVFRHASCNFPENPFLKFVNARNQETKDVHPSSYVSIVLVPDIIGCIAASIGTPGRRRRFAVSASAETAGTLFAFLGMMAVSAERR